jgi:ammonium transporter, Amt family
VLMRYLLSGLLAVGLALSLGGPASAQDPPTAAAVPDPATTPAMVADVESAKAAGVATGNIAWIIVATALVLLMMPGLALFYGGMVRRKNVLGTMMHTMIALSIVGVQWVAIGYSLSFGDSQDGYIGWKKEFVLLSPEIAGEQVAGLPIYLHAMFQGMFAIITAALVSGAIAERVRFGPYCLFILLWTTLVYDPLAHWVWGAGGWLFEMQALDFAGGTVVHIAAGFGGLAAALAIRRRKDYPTHTFHPNSMVLTLLGAGLLWMGWFGFNGGSALGATGQAVSAMAVTQVAAAAAGLSWVMSEWCLKGKPTALGFASGAVAGLVAITPASGFVAPGGALVIGGLAGVLCYGAVLLKGALGYDDTLDAFGVHGVGGFLGAILTGALVSIPVWAAGTGLKESEFVGKLTDAGTFDMAAQLKVQLIASLASAAFAFVVTGVLALAIDKTIGFTLKEEDETEGLDIAVHGEVGFDYGGGALEEIPGANLEPKAASTPPNGPLSKRFTVVVEGANTDQLVKVWGDLCKPGEAPPDPAFKAVYPYFTTMSGNKFRFRGGDPVLLRGELQSLLSGILNSPVKTHVES